MSFIKNTDVLIEGSSNLFFLESRAKSAVVDNSIGGLITDKAPSQKAVQDALDLKLNTSLKGAANGLCELGADGKIPDSQIPNLAITDVHVVANNTERDALTVQKGDVAIVTGTQKSWMWGGSSWIELVAAGYVTSVNGQSGSVSLDTDDVSEGSSNKYFTESRAKSAVVVNSSAGSETDQAMSVSAAKSYVGGQIDALSTSDIEEGSNLYFTSARAKSAAVVNSSSGSEIDQAMSVSAAKSYVGGQIDLLTTSDIEEGSNLYYTQARFDSALSGKSTSNLAEGSNLYYTQARFDSAFGGKNTDGLSEGSSHLYHTAARAKAAAIVNSSAGSETDQGMSVSAAKSYVGAQIDLLTTSDIEEGSRLYYTEARFDSRLGTKSTSDLAEGSNLYYTQARFDSALGGKSTSDLAEGSNLYHTTARARSAAVVDSSAGSQTDQAMSVSAGKSYSDAAKLLAQKLMGPVNAVSSNLSLTDSHKMLSVDCSGGSVTLTLPSTSGLTSGRVYHVKDSKGQAGSGGKYIRVQREGSNGEKIDGQNSYDIKVAYEAIMVMWDGSDWLIM